ncbi:hypothetical protein GOV10_03950, partial [Candidatus Woesearchaeota archaeon]|nr:hypothetical protein [Candidatus Woesearchaeota archaeon]
GEWYASCKRNGIPIVNDVVGELESKGCVPCNATENAKNTIEIVWGWFVALGVTKNKNMPELKCFEQFKSHDEDTIMGYYEKQTNKIFINKEFDTNTKTFVEELIHYVGEVEDFSRNWQEFALSMIVSACE